jgi:hypothetical protein
LSTGIYRTFENFCISPRSAPHKLSHRKSLRTSAGSKFFFRIPPTTIIHLILSLLNTL